MFILCLPKQFIVKKLIMSTSVNYSVDVGGMRTKYCSKENAFLESSLKSKEPIGQFKVWFDEACSKSEIIEPNAVCVSTCSRDGYPSSRYMLMKSFGKDGFRFFTNFGSRKGQELSENPRAALTFYWEPFKRSVRIEGTVERLSDEDAISYFHSRPKESQLAALSSDQSQPVISRDALVNKQNALRETYADSEIPKPCLWGGFIVQPVAVEFWQGQTDRLHDRIRFRRRKDDEEPDGILLHQGEDGWVYERLAP